jgi:hypothetical protein
MLTKNTDDVINNLFFARFEGEGTYSVVLRVGNGVEYVLATVGENYIDQVLASWRKRAEQFFFDVP